MTINANNVPSGGSKFKQPTLEAGGYQGRLVQVIDLGLQPQSFEGEEKEPKYQLYTAYELADEFCVNEDGEVQKDKPRWVSEDFALNPLNSDKAKSTKRYDVLDPGREHKGDWSKLVGKACLINIIVNAGKGKNLGKEFNNISSISILRAKEASAVPELVNDPVIFDLESPDVNVFNSLPAFLQERIKSNLEYNGSKLQAALGGTPSESKAKTEDKPW
jgi:hypothetical protein